MKLHEFYAQKIERVQIIDSKGYICNVTIECK